MTENHRMELLSRDYIKTIAHESGFINSTPELDYGVDLRIEKILRAEDSKEIFTLRNAY